LRRFIAVFLLAICHIAQAGPQPRGRLHEILEHSLQTGCLEGLRGLERLETLETAAPKLELKTDRFRLRPLTMEDAPAVIPVLTDPKVAEMSGDYLDASTVRGILAQGSEPGTRLRSGEIVNF